MTARILGHIFLMVKFLVYVRAWTKCPFKRYRGLKRVEIVEDEIKCHHS